MIRGCAIASMLLAACGRVGFEPWTGGDDGAGDPCALRTSVPDPLTISGTTIHVTNLSGSDEDASGVLVAAAYGNSSIVMTTSDADGNYSLAVPTGGSSIAVSLTFSSPSYYTSSVYFSRELDRDPAYVVNMFDEGALSSVYGAAGPTTYRFDLGTVIATTTDCSGAPLSGVSVDFTPAPVHVGYTGSGDFPAGATMTMGTTSQAVAFGATPGSIAIAATLAGSPLASMTAQVGSGSAVTFVSIQPPPP